MDPVGAEGSLPGCRSSRITSLI